MGNDPTNLVDPSGLTVNVDPGAMPAVTAALQDPIAGPFLERLHADPNVDLQIYLGAPGDLMPDLNPNPNWRSAYGYWPTDVTETLSVGGCAVSLSTTRYTDLIIAIDPFGNQTESLVHELGHLDVIDTYGNLPSYDSEVLAVDYQNDWRARQGWGQVSYPNPDWYQ